MDIRVPLTLACIAMLAAWWFLDLVMDARGTRILPPGSWLCGVFTMGMLIVPANERWFIIGTSIIAAGLLFTFARYLWMRRG